MGSNSPPLVSDRLYLRRPKAARHIFGAQEDALPGQQVFHAGAQQDARMDEYLGAAAVRHDEPLCQRRCY